MDKEDFFKKIEVLIAYIESLNVYSIQHSEDCNFVHPMSMSNYCSCPCNVWLDLKKELEEHNG